MNEMPDQELDDLFRKSAEEIEVPFDETAWRQLEQKLDGKTRNNGWLRWGLLAVLLLLVGTNVYLSEQQPDAVPATKPNTPTPAKHTAQPAPQAEARPVPAGNKDMAAGRLGLRQEKAAPAEAPHQPVPQEVEMEETPAPALVYPNTGNPPAGRKTAGRPHPAPGGPAGQSLQRTGTNAEPVRAVWRGGQARLPNHSIAALANGNTTRTRDKNGQVANPETETQPAQTRRLHIRKTGLSLKNTRTAPAGRPGSEPAPAPGLGLLVGRSIAPVYPTPAQVDFVFVPAPLRQPDIRPHTDGSPRGGARLGLRLVAAPDATTVGFRDFGKLSTGGGLLLEYNLSDRWVVSAGGLYTRKRYTAKGSDYRPASPYWTNYPGIDLRTVGADCRLIDLPVNVRYNGLRREKGTGFVSAGVSSYLMKNEMYAYTYYENNQLKHRDWSVRNSMNHMAAVGNFSLGYERNMNRRFSWQVEPFVKVPLAGVGFGKIKLVSSGVFFSIRYRPVASK